MRAIDEFFQDASDNKEELMQLLKEAMMRIAYYHRVLKSYELDALTGLPGSNKFKETTAGIGGNAAGVGVVFFDVNSLKFYNDTMGHKAGDTLLQKAAESILHITSRTVKAYRIGGDEFVALAMGSDENGMEMLLQKWREKLAELNTSDDGIHCSIAVGTAIGAEGDKIGDILRLADERMYADKKRIKEAEALTQ